MTTSDALQKPPKQIRNNPQREKKKKKLKNGRFSAARKTSTKGTRIYAYGLATKSQPVFSLDEQTQTEYRRGHRWQNLLIAAEHKRRNTIRAEESKYEEVAVFERQIKPLLDTLKARLAEIKARRVQDRARTEPSPEQYVEIKKLRVELRALSRSRNEAKWKLRDADEAHKAFLQKVREQYLYDVWLLNRGPEFSGQPSPERIELLRLFQKPLPDGSYLDLAIPYHGTRGLVSKAHEAAVRSTPMDFDRDPRFKEAWTGKGRVGLQINPPLLVKDLMEGAENSQLRLKLLPLYSDSERAIKKRRAIVSLRIGSTGKNGREPLFTEFPIVLHRPLPADGQIQYAWVRRVRVGHKERYELQLTVEADFDKPAADVTDVTPVGIDIGWRVRGDGLRVLALAKPEGAPTLKYRRLPVERPLPTLHNGRAVTEVLLPGDFRLRLLPLPGPRARWADADGKNHSKRMGKRRRSMAPLEAFGHCAKLQHIRDLAQNKMLAALGQVDGPDWFATATATSAKWRSPEKLHRLLRSWGENRFQGDEAIFDQLQAWSVQEKHLNQWQRDSRLSGERQRKDFYRCIALQLVKAYPVIKLEQFDLREVAEHPLPEDQDDVLEISRRHRFYAALSEFRNILVSTARREGTTLLGVDAESTTLACSHCGYTEKFDKKPLFHTCGFCGKEWDQDENAAQNIAAREGTDYDAPSSTNAPSKGVEPLAAGANPGNGEAFK
jgi:hypothetical protein